MTKLQYFHNESAFFRVQSGGHGSGGATLRVILVAEDDADDRLLLRRCLEMRHPEYELRFVRDGEDLLDYLNRRSPYADPGEAPWPQLVLLDLNMPRMDGRTALRALRQNEATKCIPVIVLSTSSSNEDVIMCYEDGANAFITKPDSLAGQREAYDRMIRFWFDTCILCPVPDSQPTH